MRIVGTVQAAWMGGERRQNFHKRSVAQSSPNFCLQVTLPDQLYALCDMQDPMFLKQGRM